MDLPIKAEEFDFTGYEDLEKFLQGKVDFHFKDYSESFLKRRISIRLRHLNIKKVSEYVKYINEHHEEVEPLVRAFSVNVTSFFRDKSIYTYFMKEILPQFKDKSTIKIWSAGCSTGEEPYTIAICLSEVFGMNFGNKTIKITATDISQDVLDHGKKGVYQEDHFQEMDDSLKDKYFKKQDDGYHVDEKLKSIISFEKKDITKIQLAEPLDIVFCRNMVIYLSKETKQELYSKIYDALHPGGIFVMGKTETLAGDSKNSFTIVSATEKMYQKPK